MTLKSPPVDYIERTRRYYLGLGYEQPYQWAHFTDVPFHRLSKPLDRCRVGLVTTAALVDPAFGDQGPGAAYNGAAKFFQVYAQPISPPPRLSIAHVAYDRMHTSAKDQNTYFPLTALQDVAHQSIIGSVSPRFYGLPTNRNQKTTRQSDAPALLAALCEDSVDAAILVANCPVCHQAVSLAARHLEENGLATVILGCARDIVEQAGVPRFVFSDFPLGNAAGKPHDVETQKSIIQLAVDLLETADGPRTSVQSGFVWSNDPAWKDDYSNIDQLSRDEIAHRRAEFDAAKAAAKSRRPKTP